MGLFDKFGKKSSNNNKTKSSNEIPTKARGIVAINKTMDSRFESFAQQAMHMDTSINIQASEYAGLLSSVQSKLEKTFPSLGKDVIFSQASAGFTLECPKCGVFNENAKSLLYLSGTGVLENSIYLGPNVASLGQGSCPNCGGTKIIAIFSPVNIKKQVEIAKTEALSLRDFEEEKSIISLPYLASLDISPDETFVCCLDTEGISVYGSETNLLLWKSPIASNNYCQCRFVSQSRLLVIFPTNEDQSKIQLLDVEKGTVIDEIAGPKVIYTKCDVNIEKGSFVMQNGSHELLWVETESDRLSLINSKCGQIFNPGPRFGPDGKCYANVDFHFSRVEKDKTNPLMQGYNCIGFTSPATAFSGGGYGDRSGKSELHIANLATGQISEVPWGNEPIQEIFSVDKDRVLLANIVDIVNIGHYPNCTVTLLNLANLKKEWSITISDTKPYHEIILAVEPEDGWALIQSGSAVRFISLANSEVIRYISKIPGEFTTARILKSKRQIYLTKKPGRDEAGTLECYHY